MNAVSYLSFPVYILFFFFLLCYKIFKLYTLMIHTNKNTFACVTNTTLTDTTAETCCKAANSHSRVTSLIANTSILNEEKDNKFNAEHLDGILPARKMNAFNYLLRKTRRYTSK